MRYPLNKIVITKKKHPCGSNEWQVVKTGAQIKIRCLGCNREMVLLPIQLDKIIK